MTAGLYLHFPFCRNHCSYCDFYKESYDRRLERSFYDALKIETELLAERYDGGGTTISTVFIGGGTPSLTALDLFSDWLEHFRRHFDLAEGIEFSFETNPESVDADNLQFLKHLGVNRPIFGIQSFNLSLLQLLDRRHNPHESHRAIYLANALGYENFGVDLLFALPQQTSKMLSADLDQLLELDPPHISFYQLTVEQGTRLAERVESGRLRLASSDHALALYQGGYNRLIEAGYKRYEVSSFARPGYECRHNLGYWEGKDYIGMGPSAHSFVERERFCNVSDLGEYIDTLQKGELPTTVDESGQEERMAEAIMLGLRTSRGISRAEFSERFGVPLEQKLDRQQYNMLIRSGHLIPDRGKLRLSDDGILLVDEITQRLVK